jgi:tetraacyldisaccharide 4'-kinase
VAPTWVARDRAAGARAAVAAGADVIVMDDGFQNPGLAKDLSLVVVDGETGFGNGRVMPAGPLREPVADGFERAQGVVIVGADRAGISALVAAEAPSAPVLACRLVPATTVLSGTRVYGFAGIGRPDKFRTTLKDMNCDVAGFRAFPDHHPYTATEVAALLHEADALGARAVTTAKDHVRLPADAQARVEVVEVEAVFEDGATLDRLIAGAISSSP